MSTNVRTIPSPPSDNYKLTTADIKRVNRQLRRAHSKLQRKVDTLRKIREANHELGRKIGFLKEEETSLLNPMWSPPPTYND